MKRSTMIFTVGVLLAMVISGAAFLLSQYKKKALSEAVTACLKWGSDQPLYDPKAVPWKPPPGDMVCDPQDLVNVIPAIPALQPGATLDKPDIGYGYQLEVAAAQRGLFDPIDWFIGAAILAIASAVPWFWYFMLRRLAEVRAAIGGNPPDG
jgi:hypothetical protein